MEKAVPLLCQKLGRKLMVLSAFYEYPPGVRKTIYTMNIIAGFNRQFRRITKNKPNFTNYDVVDSYRSLMDKVMR